MTKLQLHGADIEWKGEGLYHLEWIDSKPTYVRLTNIKQVEAVCKANGSPTYVEYADLYETTTTYSTKHLLD